MNDLDFSLYKFKQLFLSLIIGKNSNLHRLKKATS